MQKIKKADQMKWASPRNNQVPLMAYPQEHDRKDAGELPLTSFSEDLYSRFFTFHWHACFHLSK